MQSDKASVAITSRYDGVIKTLHFKVNEVAIIGTALLDIEIENDVEDTSTDANKTESRDQVISNSSQEKGTRDDEKLIETDNSLENVMGKVLATPAVRKIATENNIRLTDVKPTGKRGLVLKEDVLAHLQMISANQGSSSQVKEDVPTQMSVTGKTVGLKGYSRHMWKTMTKSLVSC